jgi:outer membrane protein assembly factor BamB
VSDDDGGVSCLRADKGEPIWEYRAALGRERIVGYGGFMSRWPARTGVLIHEGTAYFAAGFFPDEGTAVYAVDARTGEPRWEKGFNTAHKGSRTAGFVPDGAMALANNRLYVPSGSGMPWQVELDKPEHNATFTPGYHVKGHQIMVDGKDLLAVTPGLQYVHHVHYVDGEAEQLLPVVTKDTIYLLNQGTESKGYYLTAGKREAYELTQKRTAVYAVKKDASRPAGQHFRWKAWKNVPMTCLIEASGTLFSGGPGKVYATDAAEGKELWSAAVPGVVEDLAFHDGRLFIVCDTGSILCFGKKQ